VSAGRIFEELRVDMDEKKVWDEYGGMQKEKIFSVGPHFSFQFRHSPRHVLFSLARYKFALKMIGTDKDILELGCSDGLGTYYLAEFAKRAHGVDFDEDSVSWAQKNLASGKIAFQCDNFLGKTYGQFDAVVSYDVIEHIYPQNEETYIATAVKNLKPAGIFLVGTPNVDAQRFSKKEVVGAHVNLFTGERLVASLQKHFHNVFLFSQNDEIIHTGYAPMAHYFLCLCCFKK
jgi:2-polyprenyl-3-methyl-5-hydroxy-6-metoxy-1,4-benzoquinol methylase